MQTNEELPSFSMEFDFDTLPKESNTGESVLNIDEVKKQSRFAALTESNLNEILEEGQAKTTRYATNFGIKVFKGKTLILNYFVIKVYRKVLPNLSLKYERNSSQRKLVIQLTTFLLQHFSFHYFTYGYFLTFRLGH